MASRHSSVRPSVCDVELCCGHMVPVSSKNTARIVRLWFPLLAAPNISNLVQKKLLQLLTGTGVGYGKSGLFRAQKL